MQSVHQETVFHKLEKGERMECLEWTFFLKMCFTFYISLFTISVLGVIREKNGKMHMFRYELSPYIITFSLCCGSVSYFCKYTTIIVQGEFVSSPLRVPDRRSFGSREGKRVQLQLQPNRLMSLLMSHLALKADSVPTKNSS